LDRREDVTGVLPVVLYVPGLGSVFAVLQRHDQRIREVAAGTGARWSSPT